MVGDGLGVAIGLLERVATGLFDGLLEGVAIGLLERDGLRDGLFDRVGTGQMFPFTTERPQKISEV